MHCRGRYTPEKHIPQQRNARRRSAKKRLRSASPAAASGAPAAPTGADSAAVHSALLAAAETEDDDTHSRAGQGELELEGGQSGEAGDVGGSDPGHSPSGDAADGGAAPASRTPAAGDSRSAAVLALIAAQPQIEWSAAVLALQEQRGRHWRPFVLQQHWLPPTPGERDGTRDNGIVFQAHWRRIHRCVPTLA